MDLSNLTYTIVARNWSIDVADEVYANYKFKLKKNLEMDFTTIDVDLGQVFRHIFLRIFINFSSFA